MLGVVWVGWLEHDRSQWHSAIIIVTFSETAIAMYSASPPYQCPSTPLAPRNPLAYKPLNSSPLTCSPEWSYSSPVAAAQAHRRSQYKSLTPNTPTRIFSNSRRSSGRLFTDGGYVATPPRPDSQKLSLRNRFKARCFERAAKARERAIKGKRYAQHSSDDFTMDYDDEDEGDDEDIMQDEVRVFSVLFGGYCLLKLFLYQIFRRIMANATRKQHHSYRISYAQEVGSSIDPDLEDVASWEQELAGVY